MLWLFPNGCLCVPRVLFLPGWEHGSWGKVRLGSRTQRPFKDPRESSSSRRLVEGRHPLGSTQPASWANTVTGLQCWGEHSHTQVKALSRHFHKQSCHRQGDPESAWRRFTPNDNTRQHLKSEHKVNDKPRYVVEDEVEVFLFSRMDSMLFALCEPRRKCLEFRWCP